MRCYLLFLNFPCLILDYLYNSSMNDAIQSPFNYTGSKSNLIEQLNKYLPSDCSNGYDLFCGGGGFFVNSIDRFETIVANDIITPLMEFYSWMQKTEWNDVIKTLSDANISKTDREAYAVLRSRFNQNKNFVDFFILVCSCTNNMMRFNKSLGFNQTWGKRHFNSNTENRLKAYHDRIYGNNKIRFENKSFKDVYIPDGSFVYIDPPYLITEAGYNSYWSKSLEKELYDYLEEIDRRKIKFMFSNVMKHKGVENPYRDRLSRFRIISLDFDYRKVARKQKNENTEEIIAVNY